MRKSGILLQSMNVNAGLWSLLSLHLSDRVNRVETKLKMMSTVSKEERQRARFQEREKDKEELRDIFYQVQVLTRKMWCICLSSVKTGELLRQIIS